MSGINKLSFVASILGIALGVATSGSALAGSIADTYTTGDTLTAAKMTAVKTAVNDNDTRITAIGAGTQTCGAGMTRVGPTCVDTVRQAATKSWSEAVDFCRAANKRLLTPGEYIAAFNQAAVTLGMSTNGDVEFVDAMFTDGSVAASATSPTTFVGRLRVGYMGPSSVTTATMTPGQIYAGVDADYDNATYGIYFRCAR